LIACVPFGGYVNQAQLSNHCVEWPLSKVIGEQAEKLGLLLLVAREMWLEATSMEEDETMLQVTAAVNSGFTR
jgi:hypothetical protein